MGLEGKLGKIKNWFRSITYASIAAVPLSSGEIAALVGLHRQNGFYIVAGTLSMAACVIHWARRLSKKEDYNSLDTIFEYHPLPSITIPATIISGIVTLDLLIDFYSK